ncbi:MAG: hypothetical protein KDB40_10055 [Acidimicrobiales bacterium]|nr:hypothetical protein [Acidimicrobiales bacterium]MCB9394854.1 hypothetical protein [Acidimicrobiaceae bacterium]
MSRHPFVLVAVASALVLAACADEDSSPAAATGTTATGTTATETTAEPTTIPPATTSPDTTSPDTTSPDTTAAEPSTTTGQAAARTVEEVLALGRPVVLGHAGGEDEFPHSTPFAFANSVAAGVDVLDMDVQLTGDGVLVVHHDGDVDRTTDGTGDVAAMSYDELSLLDNAHWFTPDCVCRDQPDEAYLYRGVRTGERSAPAGFTADDFRIPRFRDIVEAWPELPLNIEIKGTGAPAIAAAEVLAAELRELDRLDAAIVTSFDDAVVDAFAALAPEVELTPGLAASTGWVLDRTPLPDGMRILQLPIEYEGLQVITPELIADSHAAGYLIWVWPNDRDWETAERYGELLDMGLDGLNINFPATGVAAVRAFVETLGDG